MIDLSTDYLGLKLKNPLVPSSSPLSKQLDSALRLEDAGAAALVPAAWQELHQALHQFGADMGPETVRHL